MSFFGKLKTRLFKSSAKLDQGLDALVSEGEEEPDAPQAPPPADPAPDTPPREGGVLVSGGTRRAGVEHENALST